MAAAHAAADGDIVAGDPVALDDGDEAEIVWCRRPCRSPAGYERDLEFARQNRWAVERVHEGRGGRVGEVELTSSIQIEW